ncbi:MAG: polynucleotide kinase-phosphatase, partial [Ornithinimicrobium sp.]
SAYRSQGVQEVVCQEKHMGSRAVILLCADAEVAARTWGCDQGQTGVVYTRTGRSFFDPAQTEAFLGQLRTAVGEAGLWVELDTDWILMDAEILPWSAKAEDLLRDQYASVGAAAGRALPAAVDGLRAARERGLDVDELLDATASRSSNASAFTAAYRRYCWSTDGLDGVRVAPFQILATHGTTHHHRDHEWHMAIADRLAAAAPDFVTATRRIIARTDDPESLERATQWWQELTDAGGEGMVVKPLKNLVRNSGKGLVLPGIKVRGREYLRIIYGPDYTEPANLERVRQRRLGHKRSLALREYALGLESLERLVAGEPLWRVHEAVFAVLALESEPVDPRL